MSTWINYHHLFYFKAIAETGTVSKAAEKLRIGQPTLSAQLKQFEENIGIQLFERNHKKLVLTEHGKVAFEYAKNIFSMGDEMYEVLHDRIKPLRPSLHIAALDSIPKQIVLKITSYALSLSQCQITVSEGKSGELLRELMAHRVDLVVTNTLPTGSDAKGILPKLISKKNVAFYGAAKFQSLKKGFPQSISERPLVLPTYDSKLRYDIDHWAKVNNIRLNIISESQDITVNKLMAENELGIMLAAAHSFETNSQKKKFYEIGQLKGVHEEIFLLSASRKIPNPVASKIMDTFHI